MVQEIISCLLFVQHEDYAICRDNNCRAREAEMGKTSGSSAGPAQGTEGNLA